MALGILHVGNPEAQSDDSQRNHGRKVDPDVRDRFEPSAISGRKECVHTEDRLVGIMSVLCQVDVTIPRTARAVAGRKNIVKAAMVFIEELSRLLAIAMLWVESFWTCCI